MEYNMSFHSSKITDEELLIDIKRVATLLGQTSISTEEYSKYGKYSYSTAQKRFGGWNKALQLCGLNLTKLQRGAYKRTNQNTPVSEELLLSDIRRVASHLQKSTISSNEYAKYCQYSKETCFRKFGTWKKALELAGLEPYVQISSKKLSDAELFEEIEKIWHKLGRQPTTTDIRNGESKFSLNTYIRHFGSWQSTLHAFITWANSPKNKPHAHSQQLSHCESIEPTQINVERNSIKTVRTAPREINLRLRFNVLQRDNFKCRLCGASPATDPNVELQIDHIVPWSKGGDTCINNLQTLCSKCNLGKSDLVIKNIPDSK